VQEASAGRDSLFGFHSCERASARLRAPRKRPARTRSPDCSGLCVARAWVGTRLHHNPHGVLRNEGQGRRAPGWPCPGAPRCQSCLRGSTRHWVTLPTCLRGKNEPLGGVVETRDVDFALHPAHWGLRGQLSGWRRRFFHGRLRRRQCGGGADQTLGPRPEPVRSMPLDDRAARPARDVYSGAVRISGERVWSSANGRSSPIALAALSRKNALMVEPMRRTCRKSSSYSSGRNLTMTLTVRPALSSASAIQYPMHIGTVPRRAMSPLDRGGTGG
jgi:hypothetical protein